MERKKEEGKSKDERVIEIDGWEEEKNGAVFVPYRSHVQSAAVIYGAQGGGRRFTYSPRLAYGVPFGWLARLLARASNSRDREEAISGVL